MTEHTSFVKRLVEEAEKRGSLISMGLDPVLEKIQVGAAAESPEKVIVDYFSSILEGMKSEGAEVGMVKPNYAFYAQYGWEGLRALKKVIELFKQEKYLVCLDAKRGDIGKTSVAYGNECFGFWGADVVTIAPYMGSDSVGAFIDWCEKGKGVYILNRTSNKGARDVQDLLVDGESVYKKVAKCVSGDWYKEGVGVVVGATYPEELEELSRFFVQSGKRIPFLIPGVGSQGGSASEVIAKLKSSGNELGVHRINSSSGITYAWQKEETTDSVGAAVRAIKKLNKEIGFEK